MRAISAILNASAAFASASALSLIACCAAISSGVFVLSIDGVGRASRGLPNFIASSKATIIALVSTIPFLRAKSEFRPNVLMKSFCCLNRLLATSTCSGGSSS